MTPVIERLNAYEILDSRGNPTVAARVTLSNGVTATGHAPSGASTGKHEALELRDGDPARYGGKGVLRAVRHIEETIFPALRGIDALDIRAIDARMIELDGAPDKSRLGANAILAVSCAAVRALSMSEGEPLWQTLAQGDVAIPVPMVNILSGGLHAAHNIEFQDFLVIAHGFDLYSEALHAITRVHLHARLALEGRGYTVTGVADEGGWGPLLPSNETALQIVVEAIERAGYRPGEQFSIALDVAASHFESNGKYELRTEKRTLTSSEMVTLLEQWTAKYPIASVEDALEQDDWNGWKELTARLGDRLQLVGDDLFTTNPERLRHGIKAGAANAVLVKMNQIGTVTETLEVLDMARRAGFHAVVSARSGETEDSFLADLAVASGAGQIKVGSITRSERLSKYNRLLEIEKEDRLPYSSKLMVPRHLRAPQWQGTRSTSLSK
jgi:enolase